MGRAVRTIAGHAKFNSALRGNYLVITIHVAPTLGETLSAYCFGRILAERFGMACAFPLLRNLVLDWTSVGANYIGSEVIWNGQWPFDFLSGRKVPREEFYVPLNARLRLMRGFARFDLFAHDMDFIRERWLAPVEPIPVRTAGVLGIALSFPNLEPEDEGDPAGNCLSETEIRRVVQAVRPAEVVLIASRRDHPLLRALADLSPSIEICTGWAQFLAIRSFQKVALSQDVGHWWAASLGEAREIYFPPLDRGPWSHPEPAQLAHEPAWHGTDLRAPSDSRFIYDW